MTMTPLARRLLSRVPAGTVVPRYGSPEWDALPDQDPRRAAAVVIAAECWRDHSSVERVAQDLLADLIDREQELRRRVREASWDVAGAADWSAIARAATFRELQQRRGEAA